ncbi:MAG: ABC transporter permease [Dehalococcoidia bacterium]|nr:MAG: ABC transporter permease [Dehalococcoidia bacterium]
MSSAGLAAPPSARRWRPPPFLLLPTLAALLAAALLLGAGSGPLFVPPDVAIGLLLKAAGLPVTPPATPQQETVLLVVRLPRVVLAALAGAGLATAGALLQGVFRNPLADPGLIGVSSGAALGAVAVIVLGVAPLGALTLPVAAFLTGLATASLVYRLAQRDGRTDITTMLLVGLATTALIGAVTGIFTFRASDPQLRSIVFWTLGGLSGALWRTVGVAAPFILLAVVLAPRLARPLNLFALGEIEARQAGVETEWVKRLSIVLAALATGAAVAVTGPIGFIGLIVPHLIRLLAGPDHRVVLPGSALGGSAFLVLADLIARTVVAPAEAPVGIITALAGAPFFLLLILQTRRRRSLLGG